MTLKISSRLIPVLDQVLLSSGFLGGIVPISKIRVSCLGESVVQVGKERVGCRKWRSGQGDGGDPVDQLTAAFQS